MASEVIEPIVRSANPSHDSVKATDHILAQETVEKKINKKVDPKKTHRSSKAYGAYNNQKNAYKSKEDKDRSFRSDMHNYFSGIYGLIRDKKYKEAASSLRDLKNGIEIKDDDRTVVEFYRIISFVEGKLGASNISSISSNLLGIIGNIRDGFSGDVT